MQYQIPSPHPLIKQAASKGPLKFNEPTILFDPTGWMNRNALYYPTTTNKTPSAQYIQPRVDFDLTVWLSRSALYYPTKTNPSPFAQYIQPRVDFDATAWFDRNVLRPPIQRFITLVTFLPPTITFDSTQWLDRSAFRFPSTTNAPPSARFIEPRIDFDATAWLGRGVLQFPTTLPPTLVPFLQARIDFDQTVWLHRNVLNLPTKTNAAPPVRFNEPYIYFDMRQWMIPGVTPVFKASAVPPVGTPRLLFDIASGRFYVQLTNPGPGQPLIRPI